MCALKIKLCNFLENERSSKSGNKTIAFTLGSWQVYRYQWKQRLIKDAQDNVSKDPVILDGQVLDTIVKNSELSDDNPLEFRRVAIENATIDTSKEIHLGPRGNDGIIGYYIISPLNLGNGRKVLFNRGFVPQHLKDQSTRLLQNQQKDVKYDILGLIGKKKERGSGFTPSNHPEKNQWYSINAQEMADECGDGTLPLIINSLQEKSSSNSKSIYYKPFNTDVEGNFHNKHLSYIITWYSLSACLTFIYWRYMRSPPPSTGSLARNQPRL
eukprot:gene3777-4701_t